jgi:hypothetical protein
LVANAVSTQNSFVVLYRVDVGSNIVCTQIAPIATSVSANQCKYVNVVLLAMGK